jgi:hypothetical protein
MECPYLCRSTPVGVTIGNHHHPPCSVRTINKTEPEAHETGGSMGIDSMKGTFILSCSLKVGKNKMIIVQDNTCVLLLRNEDLYFVYSLWSHTTLSTSLQPCHTPYSGIWSSGLSILLCFIATENSVAFSLDCASPVKSPHLCQEVLGSTQPLCIILQG